MKDPAYCAIAGRFLTCERYGEVMREGRSENCPQYWDLIGAILSAANLYRMALDKQVQQREIQSPRRPSLGRRYCQDDRRQAG